jgi:hypothetical protein
MRRVHLRGRANIRKRLLIHAGGFNLGLLLHQLIGVGTPRGLQGLLIAVLATVLALSRDLWKCVTPHRDLGRRISLLEAPPDRGTFVHIGAGEMLFTTGCYLTCTNSNDCFCGCILVNNFIFKTSSFLSSFCLSYSFEWMAISWRAKTGWTVVFIVQKV